MTSPTSGSERIATAEEFVLDAGEIGAIVSRPLDGQPGVTFRTLWEDARDHSNAGLMRLEPGAEVRPHRHRYSVHHVWVADGECVVRGKTLGPGAYSFVPAGVEHAIERAGDDGCTLFYLYLRATMD